MKKKNTQEHIKVYTNKFFTKEEIQNRAKELEMSESEYLNHCIMYEILVQNFSK